MKVAKYFAPLISFLIGETTTFSQACDCNKLLEHGIHNIVKQDSKTNDYKQERMNSCQEVEKLIKQSKSTGGGVSLPFVGFGISGNFSESQLESIKETYCSSQEITIRADRDSKYYSQIVSSDLLSEYNRCIALCAKDVDFQITQSDDDFREVVMSINAKTVAKMAPTFVKMDIDTLVFEIIDDDLYKAAINKEKMVRSYALHLKRRLDPSRITTIADSHGTRDIISRNTIISLLLDDRNTLNVNVPEVLSYREHKYINSPVIGTIMTSVFDSTAFFKLPNIHKDEWMLANGDEVPKSATFFISNYGKTVPDLRGMFIRGKNYSRNDEFGNPEGDKPKGYLQLDELKHHSHMLYYRMLGYKLGDAPLFLTLPPFAPVPNNINAGIANATQESEGSETRPKNVTLSYYIRINVRDSSQ